MTCHHYAVNLTKINLKQLCFYFLLVVLSCCIKVPVTLKVNTQEGVIVFSAKGTALQVEQC